MNSPWEMGFTRGTRDQYAQVRDIIVPDGVKWEYDLEILPNLRTIQMSYFDYATVRRFGGNKTGKVVLRVPDSRDMMQSQKIQCLINAVTPLYTAKPCENGAVHPLFMSYELAAKAWSEDLTLACLVQVGLKENLFPLDAVAPCLPEHVCKSLEKLCVEYESPYTLARQIRDDPLLRDLMMIQEKVDDSYGIKDNKPLYEAILDVMNNNVDIGLGFACDVTLEGNVVQGFDGTGSLEGCNFQLTGTSTAALNREIIRLTSEYRDSQYHMEISPHHMFLTFFGQHWFKKDKELHRLWSYPDGSIFHDGVAEEQTTVESVLTEMCYLSKQFPVLQLTLTFMASATQRKVNLSNHNCIRFRLLDGAITVEFLNNAWRDAEDRELRAVLQYQEKQRQGLDLLTDYERRAILRRNQYEKNSKSGEDEEKRSMAVYRLNNADLYYAIRSYMREHHGWEPMDLQYYLRDYQMMRFLFTYDAEKLAAYLTDKNRKILGGYING